jgi:hypothetical protein
MMHMMRYYVHLFGKGFDYQVLRDKPPYRVTEFICLVSTKTMKPYRPMRAHDDHAVKNECNQQRKRKVAGNKQIKKWQHTNHHYPAYERDPVSAVNKYIDARKSFPI